MEQKRIEPDQLGAVFSGAGANVYGKYLGYKKMFEFKVLDFYGYVSSGGTDVFWYKVQIEEVDLLRMIAIDNYSDDEKNELYYHEMLGRKAFSSGSSSGEGLEQKDLDDNVFWDLSILQYFFHISSRTLAEMKTAAHLFKLYKRSDKRVVLKHRMLHSKGGRPVGSLGDMTDSDLQNIENADRIERTCVEKDRYMEFMELQRVLIRFHKTDLTLTGAKWKFYILRYKYKVSSGWISRDLNYEKELIAKNEQYKIFEQELTF